MTAYVNDEQKKEGAYGKAVKATLAATLAAGMVPAAAAFADEPAEAAEGNDVELLSASAKDAWEAGKFTVKDNADKVVFDKKTEAEIAEAVKKQPVKFAVDGKAHYLVPTMVTPKGATVDEVFADNAEYTIEYKKDGATVKAEDIKEAGKYQVVVTAKSGAYTGADATFDFELVPTTTDIKDAKLYQVKKDEKDFSDNVVEYTGTKFYFGAKFADDANKLNIVVDGKALANGTDYAVEVFEASNPATSIGDKVPAECGKYIAKFTGKGAYTGTFQVTFDVVELDLAQAEIVLNTDNALAPVITSINGGAIANDVADVKVTAYPALGDGKAKGEYTYMVSANGSNKNVKGAQTIKHIVAANKATFKYGDKALESTYDINHVKGDKDFDLSKLVAYDKDGKALKADAYSVKVYDNKTKEEVSASKISEAGEWLVKIVVDAKATDYDYNGEAETVVTVTEGDVDANNVYFTFGGKVVKDTAEMIYDGTDALKKLGVKLYDAKGNEVAASDYKVEVKDSEGKAVTSAVNAGDYTVAVTSDKYTVAADQKLTLSVKAAELNGVKVASEGTLFADGKTFAYTGQAIKPGLVYAAADKLVELPEGSYTLTIKKYDDASWTYKEVKEMKDLGEYLLVVADNTDDANHVVAGVELKVTVTDKKVFSDVPNTAWFYEHVYNAQKVGYMKGIGDSDIFAPNQTTSRAMAAQVLARMAGAKDGVETGMSFSDVAADAWYANAVAWAATTGVVSGYPGTDEFRPENNVTRAEFCVMMQRYAAATGQGKALAAGEADEILAKYEDGAAVADWCKEAVAWAVKNEIFGGYSVLNPAGDITRAEMAKMTTVFQAAPLK
ncbi:MAG: S-layer homology domain-containing protein [Slackia faecicanis]|nr:S-layer homology domain-containing protein [Slackia faecicanis]